MEIVARPSCSSLPAVPASSWAPPSCRHHFQFTPLLLQVTRAIWFPSPCLPRPLPWHLASWQGRSGCRVVLEDAAWLLTALDAPTDVQTCGLQARPWVPWARAQRGCASDVLHHQILILASDSDPLLAQPSRLTSAVI